MKVHVLGARGSTPATGAAFQSYGGDTSCVAISEGDAAPTLVLDAGTGLINLTALTSPFRGTIVLTHLHWDHTHGLPFSRAVDHPEAEVRLLVPDNGEDPELLLARAIGPPHFPIEPNELRGTWRFETLDEGTHQIEGYDLTAREVAHKGGRTFGFRVVDDSGHVFAYVPDHSPGHGDDEAMRDIASHAGLLFHDSQDVESEWPDAAPFGHCTVEKTAELGLELGVARTVLFHHSPTRTDSEIDAIRDRLGASIDGAAAQGDIYDL